MNFTEGTYPPIQRRSPDGVLRMDPRSFSELHAAIDRAVGFGYGADSAIAEWLRQNRYDVESFKFQHTDIVVDYDHQIKCPDCYGPGARGLFDGKLCETCNATGMVHWAFRDTWRNPA